MMDCGKSSFLYCKLVEEKKIFNSISVEFDICELEGNLLISGLVNKGIEIDVATNELLSEINNFVHSINEQELIKAKNNLKMEYLCDTLDLVNCSDVIANSFVVDDMNYINDYTSRIDCVRIEEIKHLSEKIFTTGNKIVFKYKN